MGLFYIPLELNKLSANVKTKMLKNVENVITAGLE